MLLLLCWWLYFFLFGGRSFTLATVFLIWFTILYQVYLDLVFIDFMIFMFAFLMKDSNDSSWSLLLCSYYKFSFVSIKRYIFRVITWLTFLKHHVIKPCHYNHMNIFCHKILVMRYVTYSYVQKYTLWNIML